MIQKYNNFYEDLLIENMINESVIYFSERLNKTLKNLNDDISKDLIKIQATNISQDVTMVDISKDGYFSYSTERNATNNLNDNLPSSRYSEYLFNKEINRGIDPDYYVKLAGNMISNKQFKSRNKIKIGRLINKLFPNKYNSIQLEDYTEKIKASIKKLEEHFELVEGEDIDNWYWYQNYSEMGGTLGNSCMSKKRGIFDIYNKNKDVCKLLILLKDDKLIGRALVWKLKTIKASSINSDEIKYFMDRQYTIYQSDVVKFRNYADEQGWCYKTNNNHYSYEEITYKNKNCNSSMTVEVSPIDYNNFPYMDTFRRYDPFIYTLYNDNYNDNDEYEGNYILDSTTGDYTEIEGGVWSEYEQERIPEDEAVWSSPFSDYLRLSNSVEVREGSRDNIGWYPRYYEYIVTDYNDNYLHIDDAVWSSILDNYILSEDAVSIIDYINEKGDTDNLDGQYINYNYENKVDLDNFYKFFWYEHITNKYSAWEDYNYIDKNLLTFNYKKEYILKEFAEKSFRIKNSDKYLIKVDAIILNKDVELNDTRIIDLLEYTIKEVDYDEILEKGDKMKKILSDNLEGKNQLHLEFGDENDENYINSTKFRISEISKRIKFIKNII